MTGLETGGPDAGSPAQPLGVEELIDELDEKKILHVRSPHNDGLYILQITGDVPEEPVSVYWIRDGRKYHEEIEFHPSIAAEWIQDEDRSEYDFYSGNPRGHAELILNTIFSGIRLNELRCGGHLGNLDL